MKLVVEVEWGRPRSRNRSKHANLVKARNWYSVFTEVMAAVAWLDIVGRAKHSINGFKIEPSTVIPGLETPKTREHTPLEWAMIQYNLALTVTSQSARAERREEKVLLQALETNKASPNCFAAKTS